MAYYVNLKAYDEIISPEMGLKRPMAGPPLELDT